MKTFEEWKALRHKLGEFAEPTPEEAYNCSQINATQAARVGMVSVEDAANLAMDCWHGDDPAPYRRVADAIRRLGGGG